MAVKDRMGLASVSKLDWALLVRFDSRSNVMVIGIGFILQVDRMARHITLS